MKEEQYAIYKKKKKHWQETTYLKAVWIKASKLKSNFLVRTSSTIH